MKTQRTLTLAWMFLGLLYLTLWPASAATRHWTGASGTNWTTAANWSNNVAPVAGDLLIFLSGAANRTNFNNYANGTAFSRIEMLGSYTLSGNRITLGNGLLAFSLTSPTMTVNNNLTLSADQTFTSSSSTIGNPLLLLRGNLDLNGRLLTLDCTDRIELAGDVTGTGNVRKLGIGTLMVSGISTFVGSLNVESGSARVDGTLANAFVVLPASGSLSGTGRVHGINGSGVLSPGNSGPGRLTSTADVNLGSTGIGTYRVDLDGTNAGINYDQLRVQGTVFGNGMWLVINLRYPARVGDTFVVLDNDGTDAISGATALFPLDGTNPYTTNGYSFWIQNRAGGDGNDTDLTVVRVPDSPFGMWDGGAPNGFWTSGANWVGNTAPLPGHQLRFEAFAAANRRIATNDFPAGTSFSSLFLGWSNYVLRGNSIALTGGITNVAPGGINTCQVALAISGTLPVLSENSTLSLQSPISGSGGLVKQGTGELQLVGTANNTYTGDTVVSAGTLRLAGAPGRSMVPGGLVVGDGAGTDTVVCNDTSQFPDTVPVTIRSSGLLNLNGNNHTIGTLTLEGGSVASGAGVLRLGGNLVAGASTVTASVSGLLNLNGQNLGFNVSDGPPASDLVISAVINNGGVNKLGAGTLELTGNNTYTSPTTVSTGRLLVNGTQAGSAVTLNGGTLAGNGTIGPLAANIGIVSPGTSAGRLTVNGNATLGAFAILFVEVNGVAAGTGYDQLVVSGVVNLAGGTLAGSMGFASTPGNVFTIIANDGADAVQGTFADLPQGAVFLLGGAAFSISYTGGTGNDVVLTRVVGPSTLSGATRLPNGQFRFQGLGEPSLTYIIQAHTNLNTPDWSTIGIAPADGAGLFQFLDPNAPLFPRRFYRAISP